MIEKQQPQAWRYILYQRALRTWERKGKLDEKPEEVGKVNPEPTMQWFLRIVKDVTKHFQTLLTYTFIENSKSLKPNLVFF